MEHFRLQYTELKERILEKRRFIQVLSGPRQIGKTTMVLQLLKELPLPYLFVSADGVESSNRNWIEQQWEIARLKLKQATPRALD
jgi:predicted AAA+ superfamily ATPase